jgi:predicted TIM-barrel fold metal-dependent hydrolase
MIIDAHLHLWKKQKGFVDGLPVYDLGGGKSQFGNEIRQMLPPYMEDGYNSVERLIANMDYAGVNGCVVTQEYIDGNQNTYLLEAKHKYPDRINICSLYEETDDYTLKGFNGIKICAGRLSKKKLSDLLPVFQAAGSAGMFISIDLAEGASQVEELRELINKCPEVKVAIGHFGMAGRNGFEEQIKLACYPNVYIESGGITWLFHKEFYPYPSAVEAILRARDICGMEKLMWGSDYPRTMTAITYPMSFDFIQKSDRLTSREKEQFLWENAKEFYGFTDLEKIPYVKNMVEE